MSVRVLNQFQCFTRTSSIRKYGKKAATHKEYGVTAEDVLKFMVDALVKVGTPEKLAKQQADLLLYADEVGHYSHGMNRLPLYIKDIEHGSTKADGCPEILNESTCTAWVDGKNALGATTGHFCMDLCNCKAKRTGVGVVSCKGGNHYGMAGYWAMQAQKKGFIGFTASNTSPLLVPTRGKDAILGTNPVALAAPGKGNDNFIAEMAASTVALGKIEIELHKGKKIPDGWAMDKDGNVTRDAEVAFAARRLLPLGGRESTSGFKGYALSAMVEILTSALSGSKPTHKIRGWSSVTEKHKESANLGFFFISLNPGCFAPGFRKRVNDLMQTWRSTKPIDPKRPVLAPGDLERNRRKECLDRGTIIYTEGQIKVANTLAQKLDIDCLNAEPIE